MKKEKKELIKKFKVVIEDLMGVRNATERVKTQNRYVSVSWSFYDIEQKLIYKAKQNSLW